MLCPAHPLRVSAVVFPGGKASNDNAARCRRNVRDISAPSRLRVNQIAAMVRNEDLAKER